MNANHELERRIADYYASEAPPRAPEWVLESALATIASTRQRRALRGVPRRFQYMPAYAKLAAVAVIVVAVGLVGLAVFRPGPAPGVGGPSPTPSPTPTTSPSQASSSQPALTETFTSSINGLTLSYPAGWDVEQANRSWTTGLPGTEEGSRDTIGDPLASNPDHFIGLASQPLAGRTGEAWTESISASNAWGADGACDPLVSDPVTVDGMPGIVVECPNRPMHAMAWTADRGYWIVLYGIDDRAWLDEVLATVRFHPEDALGSVTPPPSASPSGS